MSTIISYFKIKLEKNVVIHTKIKTPNKCIHCGYGKQIKGTGTIINNDLSKENIIFSYWSGCLTYDEEMDCEYEDDSYISSESD